MTHASALWTSETCTSRRVALQWALFPVGLTTREHRKIETPITCLEFFELMPRSLEENRGVEGLVDQTGASWNRLASWLRRVEALRATA